MMVHQQGDMEPHVDTNAPREIELKLTIDPQAETDLDLAGLDLPGGRLRFRRQMLETTYYDTEDGRLRRRRMALRVRKSGDRYLQTLKTAGTGGALSVRGEWETPLDGPVPDVSMIGDADVVARLGLILPEQLDAMFVTLFDRQKALWSDGGNEVEIAFDRGRIEAGDRQIPIAEIELELKGGEARAIFELVERIRHAVPVRIGTEPKADRGYRLRHDQPPAWTRSGVSSLEPSISLEQGIRTILRDCLTHWIDNEPAALDGRDSEGVHQLRVGIRRMRSALALFHPWLDPSGVAALEPRLKRALKALGPAREIDVFIEDLLEPCWNDILAHIDPAALLEVTARARKEAYADLHAWLGGRDYADLVLDLVAWVELDRWKGEHVGGRLRTVAEVLLEKRHRKLLRRGRGFDRLPDEKRHELRLDLKKLRYAVDFLSPLFSGRKVKKGRKSFARLQEGLGNANDLAECRLRIEEILAREDLGDDRFEVAKAAGFLHGWTARALTTTRAETDAAWNDFVENKPFWR